MIGKSQLIKRVTEKAGLLPFDSEQFFETFILRISERISAGEVLELKGLGYFSLKSCKLRFQTSIELESSEKEKSIPMILFSEEAVFNEENKNIHFFSIPETTLKKEDDIDSHLSLSIEKPLIVESEFAEEIFSAFKSNSEIRENFASKAEILINTMQKTDVDLVEEFSLNNLPEVYFVDEIKNEKTQSGDELIKHKEKVKRISANGTGDTASSLPWDFGRKFFERKIDYPEQERIDAQINHQRKEEKPEADSESFDEERITKKTDKESLESENSKVQEEKNEDRVDAGKQLYSGNEEKVKTDRFERVKTFVSGEMKSKEKSDIDENERIKTEELKSEKVKKSENDFTPVKSKSETYRLKPKKKKPFLSKKNSISLSEANAKYNYHRSRRRILPYAVPSAILIVLIAIVYIFLFKDLIFSGEPENVVVEITPPPHVNIIERDFEFAVTFPYSKSETDDEISGIDPLVFSESVRPVDQKPQRKVNEKEKKFQSEVKTDNKIKENLVREVESRQKSTNKNISKYKDYYIVQVAAYKTYENAEAEAEKFRNQGYNAFIEIAELPGRGTWYRIRVGDFTSVKNAEDFLRKNRN